MEILFTKDTEWFQKWDAFVLSENKASHLMLAQWNASFLSYGFDYEICLLLENGIIRGGFAGIIAKALVFRFYVVANGPVVSEGFENHLDTLTAKVPERAKACRCCYAHIHLPFSNTANEHVYNIRPYMPSLGTAKPGNLFKYVYTSHGLNWLDLRKADTEEGLLETFKSTTRRDIRSSERKGLELKFLETQDEVKMGYDLCLKNAEANQYALRDWASFGPTLMTVTANKTARFLAAFHNGTIKGAILLIKGGNYYTYVLGGSKREKPDLLAGHFLQWQAIKLSFAEGYSGYNLSLGGSSGVVKLKDSFADGQVWFSDAKYHWIIQPFYLKCFMFVERKLKPHKKIISKLLSK